MITVFTRPKCHLCEEALTVLLQNGIAFTEIDISKDAALEREFGIFVPVVQVDGKTIFEAGMDPTALPVLLRDESAG